MAQTAHGGFNRFSVLSVDPHDDSKSPTKFLNQFIDKKKKEDDDSSAEEELELDDHDQGDAGKDEVAGQDGCFFNLRKSMAAELSDSLIETANGNMTTSSDHMNSQADASDDVI